MSRLSLAKFRPSRIFSIRPNGIFPLKSASQLRRSFWDSLRRICCAVWLTVSSQGDVTLVSFCGLSFCFSRKLAAFEQGRYRGRSCWESPLAVYVCRYMNRDDGLHVNVTKSETVLSAVEETHQQGSKLRERRIKVKLDLVFFFACALGTILLYHGSQ